MFDHFHVRNTLDDIIRYRKGEVKLGERFRFLENHGLSVLGKSKNAHLRFALIGIPESIGILANHGSGGAENSWQEFLFQIVNQQSNRFMEGSEILCLGQVETKDLQKRAYELNSKDGQFYTKLRSICQELDQRVIPVIEYVTRAGLVPVVIGGGHNNAFPIIKGVCQGLELASGMSCLNLDAHGDFRPLEGRHSGNGFSYAFYQNYLRQYYVLGLQEQSNSEAMLKNMDLEDRVSYQLFQPGEDPEILSAISFLKNSDETPIGLEVDLDALAGVPASAYAVNGYSIEQVINLIRNVNQQIKPAYLHLAEAQVRSSSDDARIVGKTLCTLVMEFIKSYPR